MANSSSKSNGDMPFSVDIDDYGDADVVAFYYAQIGKFKAAIKKCPRCILRLTYITN